MATDPLPYTDADRDVDAGLAALARLLHGPLVNTPVTHGLAALALELERLRERVAALEKRPTQPTRPAPLPADGEAFAARPRKPGRPRKPKED